MKKLMKVTLALLVLFTFLGCNTTKSVMNQSVELSFVEAPYHKLSSPAFTDSYNGKGVIFNAMFIGELNLIGVYGSAGISTEGKVFINHRDINYQSKNVGFAISDAMMPPFALSIEADKADLIYNLKNGDIVKVIGVAEEASSQGYGSKGLHIRIHELTVDE